MRTNRVRGLVVALGLLAMLTGSAMAWRPTGWAYFNWPYAYDRGSGDWYYFSPNNIQWAYGLPGNGWQRMNESDLAHSWDYFVWPYAYCHGNRTWHYFSANGRHWCVNLRTGVWSIFGALPFPGSVALPGFDPDGGEHAADSVNVTVTCVTAGATIHYTTDRSEPTEASPTVASGGEVNVPVPGTLSAKAFKAGMNPSATKAADYTAPDPVDGSDYMVIDLSGGPEAENYPVSYLTSVPDGGWTDEYMTTKMVLRRIPAGTFTMGSPPGELGRVAEREAQRQVTLAKDFYMGVYEVTQKQWERVMGDWPSWFNNADHRDARPVETVSWDDARGGVWPGDPTGTGAPAAGTFVDRVRARTGLSFDLPTEAQWEYACRAGTATALNSGKNLTAEWSACPNMAEVGRYWLNGGSGYTQGGVASAGTAKVGSYLPNVWGLYDMHGNVWEWCLDWYLAYHAPTTDPVGAAAGSNRVLRGGCWNYYAWYCRSANRDDITPSARGNPLGFRLSRTLP